MSSKKPGSNYRQCVIHSRMKHPFVQDKMNPLQQLYLLLCSNNIHLCPLHSFYILTSSWPYCHLHVTVCATLLFSQLVAALGIKTSTERLTRNSGCYSQNLPVPVAARSKALVWALSLAGIVGSNPAGGINICLLWVLWVVRQRSLRRADHSSRGVLPSVVCLCVIVKPR